ncbi:hypothetical protein RB653_001398 [Dictyostelium firmibasis]|uniref:Uncharacterized protein n=1 Tax=Dictyostelium firmibasis TaxID=79012 RepID=A0AAN7U515_9MYCE
MKNLYLTTIVLFLCICFMGNVKSSSNFLYSSTSNQNTASQTFSKIDLDSNEVIFNHTLTNLHYVIVDVLFINQTNVIFFGANEQTEDNILIEYKYENGDFIQSEEFLKQDSITLLFSGKKLAFINQVVIQPLATNSTIMMAKWDFQNNQFSIINTNATDIHISNEEYNVYNAYDSETGLIYYSYQTNNEINTDQSSIGVYDPTNDENIKSINGIKGVDPNSIKLLFCDNSGGLYAISNQLSSAQSTILTICKYDFNSLNCEIQFTKDVGQLIDFTYDITHYYPIVQSFDDQSLMIIVNTTENGKPILNIEKYDISTWSLLSSSSIENFWTSQINHLNF